MKRLDLIIDALEELMYSNSTHIAAEKFCEALAAARELRDMKPVAWVGHSGNLAYSKDSFMPSVKNMSKPLYALGDEK